MLLLPTTATGLVTGQADLVAITDPDVTLSVGTMEAVAPIPPSIAGIMAEGLDPAAEIAAASAFLESLIPLEGRQIRAWLDALPPEQANAVRYQEPPTALMALTDTARVRSLPMFKKCHLIEGMVRLFSADGSFFDFQERAGEIIEFYFSLWINDIFDLAMPDWSSDRDEAWQLFLFAARLMTDPSLQRAFRCHSPDDQGTLQRDLADPVRSYGDCEAMAGEVIGILQDMLASPHLDGEHETRAELAVAMHNHERARCRLAVGNYHLHGRIDPVYDDDRRQAIFDALLRSSGLSEMELRAWIRARETNVEIVPRLNPDFDEPEYYGAD